MWPKRRGDVTGAAKGKSPPAWTRHSSRVASNWLDPQLSLQHTPVRRAGSDRGEMTDPFFGGAAEAVGALLFIGTATTLIRYGNLTLLTDPNFCIRASGPTWATG